MPNITLYLANGSCSMAAHILLQEIGVSFETISMTNEGGGGWRAVDGTLSNAEYRKRIHHMGYVPALQVDDQVITENPAILTYIASLAPERNLMGSTALESAQVLSWLAWLSGTLHGSGYGALWRPGRYSDDENQYPAIKEKGMKTIRGAYERIEQVLNGVHAVGDQLSVADLYLHVFFRWGGRIEIDMKADYPKYAELIRSVERLISLQEVSREERIPLAFP